MQMFLCPVKIFIAPTFVILFCLVGKLRNANQDYRRNQRLGRAPKASKVIGGISGRGVFPNTWSLEPCNFCSR